MSVAGSPVGGCLNPFGRVARLPVLTIFVLVIASSVIIPINLSAQPADAPALVETLINDLADRSYARRQEAERQLRQIGPAAIPALTRARGTSHGETAIRVDRLLTELRGDLFLRARVSLSVTPARIAWDEPVTVRVTYENPTEFDMEIPLVPQTASQVGLMLDMTDHLVVIGPDKTEVPFHLIDIKEDPAVEREVERRLGRVEATLLEAGTSRTVDLTEFNRGWARYRMLWEGVYTIQYRWLLAQQKDKNEGPSVGIFSNVVQVEVTRSAPPQIDPTGVKLAATLKRVDDVLEVRLINTYDQIVNVYTDIGPASAPFAQFRWRIHPDRENQEPFSITEVRRLRSDPAMPRFVELKPGEPFLLFRKPVADMWKLNALKDLPPNTSIQVSAVYANVYCRSVLGSELKRLDLADPSLREELPPRFVFTGTATSEPVTLSRP